jgi:hypothetical protein
LGFSPLSLSGYNKPSVIPHLFEKGYISISAVPSGDLTAENAENAEEEKREMNDSDTNGFDITRGKNENQ